MGDVDRGVKLSAEHGGWPEAEVRNIGLKWVLELTYPDGVRLYKNPVNKAHAITRAVDYGAVTVNGLQVLPCR